VQVAQEMDPVANALASLQTQILLGLPLALVLAIFGGFFLVGRALRPVERITATAEAIDAGDLSRRIGYRGPADEVGRLAATFDRMLDRLEKAFARERRFTGDAAHELRTPLTAMKGQIEVALSRQRSGKVYVETLREIGGQVERLIRISNDLLFMTRLEQAHGKRMLQEEVALSELLPTIVDQVRLLAAQKEIAITQEIGERVDVEGDLDLLIRLFLNLLDNAIKYTPPGGMVTVAAQAEAEEVVIVVSDTGAGIEAEHLPHLFERFYRVEGDRARPAGGEGHGGAGLGLAIAAEIVRVHGGTIRAKSVLGEGTSFIVRLPRA
jgi:heavy metal sensor kinase